MQSVMNILVLALCLGLTTAAVQRSILRPDTSLMQFMVENRAMQSKSPQKSIECFNYYTPLLNEIASKYETDYETCYQTAAAATKKLNSLAEAQRNSLNSLATSSCNAIASCYTLSDVQSSFECYQSVSTNNTKEFYTISSTAQDDLTDILEQERVIEFEEGRCTDECDRTYVKDTSETYEELQSCLAGLSAVPTTTKAPASTKSSTSSEAPSRTESSTSSEARASTEEDQTSTESTDETSSVEPTEETVHSTIEPSKGSEARASTEEDQTSTESTDETSSVEPTEETVYSTIQNSE